MLLTLAVIPLIMIIGKAPRASGAKPAEPAHAMD
jgi:hypothetical protein